MTIELQVQLDVSKGAVLMMEDCHVICNSLADIEVNVGSGFIARRNIIECNYHIYLIRVDGDAWFQDCLFKGLSRCLNFIFVCEHRMITVLGCTFKNMESALVITGAHGIINHCTFEYCKLPIHVKATWTTESENKEEPKPLVGITNCKITNAVIGIFLQDCYCVDITGNTFINIVGPAVCSYLSSPTATLSVAHNIMQTGKTAAVWLKNSDESLALVNTISGFPKMGIPEKDPLGPIVGAIIALLDLNEKTPSAAIGAFLKDLNMQIPGLCKVLRKYPTIFSVTDSEVSWSTDLYLFPASPNSTLSSGEASAPLPVLPELQEQPSKKKKKKKQNINQSSVEASNDNATQSTELDMPPIEKLSIHDTADITPNVSQANLTSNLPSAPEQIKSSQVDVHSPQALEDFSDFTPVSNRKKTKNSSKPATSLNSSRKTQSQPPKPATASKATSNESPANKPKRKDWSKDARKIFDRTGGLCYLCRQPMKFESRQKGQEGAWHIEHVMPFSKYPELDDLANLLPAHIHCDSCKGAKHLQSIMNEADFDLLTMTFASLHPRVAQELKAAKELYKQQNNNNNLPSLLNSTHFPPLHPGASPSPAQSPAKPETQKQHEPKSDKSKKYPMPNMFIIKYSDVELSTEMLGSGGFSTVWKAKYNGTPVAVKKISNMSEEHSALFQKEVSILSNLRHPNVILMIGICLPPDPCCIVTELFERGSLHHLVHSKDLLTSKQKIGFVLDIARGMSHLHSRNILHGDLKPLNVMVDNSGTCKIADFGLSQVLSLTTTGNQSALGFAGSLWYLAPERLEETPKSDFASDVYAFGITLWQIWTRTFPYPGASHVAILLGVPRGTLRPQIPSDCPAELGSLMSQCWHQDIKQRPTFQEIAQTLEKIS